MEVEREKEEGERVWGERKENLQNRVTEVGVRGTAAGGREGEGLTPTPLPQ